MQIMSRSSAFVSSPPLLRARAHRAATCTRMVTSDVSFDSLFPTREAARVLTCKNEPVSITSYVSENNAKGNAVLLGWLRHYGCTLCKRQAAEWREMQHNIGELCVNMALIGNGTPLQAVSFARELEWKEEHLLSDVDCRTYEALGFKRGIGCTFNLKALNKVYQSYQVGHVQTWSRMSKHPFQQGGVVFVNRFGIVSLLHLDAFAGDHMNVDDLLNNIRKLIEE